jgi:hypothetical protein
MTTSELEQLKYPEGKIQWETDYTPEVLNALIEKIEAQPGKLYQTVHALSLEQLKYSYRPGGWNVQQIIHHIADSSLNAYIRTKLTLTEDRPVIKPYNENKWADLFDSEHADFLVSVHMLDTIHKRWVVLLKSLNANDFDREYFHPEMDRNVSLKHLVSIYAWHGDHHIAQIKVALEKKFGKIN